MITEQQILQAKGDDLSRLLGEVLQPQSRHAFNMCGRCIDCNQYKGKADDFCKKTVQIHWSTAMKWRDWAVEKFGKSGFMDAYLSVIIGEISSDGNYLHDLMSELAFTVLKAQPEHYLKASAICEIRSKK